MIEEWRDVPGYEGLYKVSNLGRLLTQKGEITQGSDSRGYLTFRLARNNVRMNTGIHRLVAKAFLPNPEDKPHVNHIDGDKKNNRVDNLEWATSKENVQHAYNTGLTDPRGGAWKLTHKEIVEIAVLANLPENTHRQLAKQYGVSKASITGIACGYSYSDITGIEYSRRETVLNAKTAVEICELYKQGIKIKELAKQFNTTHQVISNVISGRNWSSATGIAYKPSNRAKLSAKTKEEIRQRLSNGERNGKLAKEYGCSPAMITKIKQNR